jgi:hypothetical protein
MLLRLVSCMLPRLGCSECYGEQAAIAVGILLFAIPFSLFGAKMRHRTAQWRIIL